MDVAVVRWPEEASRRETLRLTGIPRLLLIEAALPPPLPDDDLEDWIRVPADAADIQMRVFVLDRRSRERTAVAPELDPDGVLQAAGAWVALPRTEARLMRA